MRDKNVPSLKVLQGRESRGERYYDWNFWRELEELDRRSQEYELWKRRLAILICGLVFISSIAILGWMVGSSL